MQDIVSKTLNLNECKISCEKLALALSNVFFQQSFLMTYVM